MPRPKLPRCLQFSPKVDYFKPAGIPMRLLEEVELFPDEIEAVKLYHVDELDQRQSSEKMGISQPTFARILESASKKIANALVNGKAIKLTKKMFLFPFLFQSMFLVTFFLSSGTWEVYASDTQSPSSTYEGRVIEVTNESEVEPNQFIQTLKIKINTGDLANQVIEAQNGFEEASSIYRYKVGDELVLTSYSIESGKLTFVVNDYVRRGPLVILFSLFILVSVVVAGRRGIFSFLGMAVTFVMIFWLVLPWIGKGVSPILVIIVFSILAIPETFFLSHGFNLKTVSAVFGTFISLVVTVLLSTLFVSMAKLTGFSSDEAAFLQMSKGTLINMQGILLSGIVVGVLGVLDDITVSQSAVVFSLKKANKRLTDSELFTRAMDVGKDHIASMVNTLILVYAGASLPLLLLFMDSTKSFSEVINYEIISSEIVRTLLGSIGLILAVPITTIIAAKMVRFDSND